MRRINQEKCYIVYPAMKVVGWKLKKIRLIKGQ
jgi:hypothetical protein